MAQSEAQAVIREGSGPLDDLALTLPIFCGYHLGVVFLPLRNAADGVTHQLVLLANHNLWAYVGLTLAIGLSFATVLLVLGREQSMSLPRFLWVALEGVLYAIAMRLAADALVGKLHLGLGDTIQQPLSGLVMSLGAGFYEELVFRVGLFGLGARLVVVLLGAAPRPKRTLAVLGWAVLGAALFSAWHHVGAFGEPLEVRAFIFRWICGIVFTVIYRFRGFAPAVWTHALYDIWILVF